MKFIQSFLCLVYFVMYGTGWNSKRGVVELRLNNKITLISINVLATFFGNIKVIKTLKVKIFSSAGVKIYRKPVTRTA